MLSTTDLTRLARLRTDLVTTRAELREAEDHLTVERAAAEERVIKGYYNPEEMGRNAEDRKRTMILALETDLTYCAAIERARHLQQQTEDLAAQVAILEDKRRNAEWEIRSRLAEGLMAAYAAPQGSDPAFALGGLEGLAGVGQ